MNLFSLGKRVKIAANQAAERIYWIPPAGVTWHIEELSLMPSETSPVHATDYADITAKSGTSTAITATRSTNSGTGSALTQGTAETLALTGTKPQRAITQANPFYLLVDTSPGGGVAVDFEAVPTFSVART